MSLSSCSVLVGGFLLGVFCILIGILLLAAGMRSRATVHAMVRGAGFGIQAVVWFIPIAIGLIIIFAAFVIGAPLCAMGG